RREVDAWWAGLAAALRAEGIDDVPDSLERSLAFDALWSAPDLLLAQACGYPLMIEWSDRLQYLATPRHRAPGCEGSNYCSWLVVAADSRFVDIEDLRGAQCSINGRNSHSGYNALRAHVAPLARNGRFFGAVRVSGGHAESLAQIARGEADIAAIDCVTYELLRRCRSQAIAATRIIGRTQNVPGLPYVTAKATGTDACRRLIAGLESAFADPRLAAVRDALLISGLDRLPLSNYDCMIAMRTNAERDGYSELG
ncbi:MAG: PhnD/SsuA/transferrin family substrate-binding protein, partial [Betaproteobacteria bacterium]